MTTFSDSAHVNAGKLASALADRGYLTPDQASQMCDGFVSLHNVRQAQDAFNNAASSGDGESAVLAAGLAAHLGIALQTQVAAEQTGLTQKGETLNEGVVDMLRDVVSSMKSDAGSDSFVGGNASADAAPLTSDASDNVVPRDMSMASSSASGAYGAYNAVPAMQANPLSMLTAFAVGNMVGSRAFGRNDWNNVWGNEWAVPRRPVLRPAQLIAPLQQTQIGRNAPIARQPVRSPAVPSNPPSRWTPPSGQHPQHQRSPAQQVPVSQQQPTILPDPQHVRRRA